MNWDRIEGQWEQFKADARIEWGQFTDDELEVIAGKKDKLAGMIQEKYGLGKDKAEQAVEEWKEKLTS
ncbi:CsbD family protein [Marinicella sediminis]|uniref:CsbD family protein n=1 Tax=Marinicella sediminis TaxID=1792834 RepID=A0ABV7J7N5_9GAMM|nr:CsbD family protein [Marinicella sediminis]